MQSTSLVVLLMLALGVTGILTYQANKSDQDHRTNTEWLLSNYSALVATRYAELATMNLASHAVVMFRPLIMDPPASGADLTPSFSPDFSERCGCEPAAAVRARFTYDFLTDRISAEPALTEEQATEIRAILRQNSGIDLTYSWKTGYQIRSAVPGEVLMFAVHYQNSVPIAAFGISADASVLRSMLPAPLAFVRDLPREVENDVTYDEVFEIAVEAPSGALIAGSTAGNRTYNGTAAFGNAFGDIRVTASLNPEAALTMLKAGAPKSRLPLLLALLAATTLLIGASVYLTRRQSDLSRERADFVSSVSHELRTPLAQIRMFTETLLLGRIRNDAERKRSLEIIDQEARRLSQLVENVLQVSRTERGVARVAPSDLEVAPAVREIVDMFAQMPKAKAVQFRLELQDRLHAIADRNALTQILQNLLENAVKYGPSGQRIDVGLALFDDRARLWVDDEGPGIPARERERVFELFYRSPRDMESRVLGSGLGLAVVRQLADSLGGRVWADEAPGGGARIVVEFSEAYLRAEESETGWAVA